MRAKGGFHAHIPAHQHVVLDEADHGALRVRRTTQPLRHPHTVPQPKHRRTVPRCTDADAPVHALTADPRAATGRGYNRGVGRDAEAPSDGRPVTGIYGRKPAMTWTFCHFCKRFRACERWFSRWRCADCTAASADERV